MVRPIAAAVLAAACLNEAAGTGMRLMSMHEVMSKTTIESAAELMLKQHDKLSRGRELVSLIQDLFAVGQKQGGLRASGTVKRHDNAQATASKAVTSSGGSATEMLNQMLSETSFKLELEQESCRGFNRSRLAELKLTRENVARFNSEANQARGRVLEASGQITSITTMTAETQEALKTHNKECEDELANLNEELRIVNSDLDVMAEVLKLTTCDDAGTSAAASFVQTAAETSASALVSCAHCNRGRGLFMLQDAKVQSMLNQLKSQAAHAYLHHHLKFGYQEAAQRVTPVALTQAGIKHMRRLASVARRSLRAGNDTADNDTADIAEVPEEPVAQDCTFTDKCTLSPGSCKLLRDRFLLIQAGVMDKKEQLSGQLGALQDYCEGQSGLYREQLEAYETRLGEQQTNLATASGEQNEAESGSHLKAEEFDSLKDEYHKKMTTCCDNQNDLMSEICALNKIRGELEKLSGEDTYITDCEVSDWRFNTCDKECGGGERLMERSVLVHEAGGMVCPALEGYEACNEEQCPVDCIVEEWGGWSSCTAECDGGTQTRSRSVRVQPAFGGTECGALTETAQCNVQSCNKDCVLKDWTEWTPCSKECDGGHSRRHRAIAEPAAGTGTCVEEESEERLAFKKCNEMTCASLLPTPSSLFTCQSKVDIIILLDGSGSLGYYGWHKSKEFAKKFIGALEGSDDNVKAALMLFSGPRTWEDYYKCIDSNQDVKVDMEADCSIKWVKRFTNDTAALADMAGNLDWPAASTLTSVALAETEAMLIHGREDAETLVIVVTDGWPISQQRTRDAANQLKQKANVLWVPVGTGAPLDLIEELASLPKEDHIVPINYFFQLDTPDKINDVLATACGKLGIPSA